MKPTEVIEEVKDNALR